MNATMSRLVWPTIRESFVPLTPAAVQLQTVLDNRSFRSTLYLTVLLPTNTIYRCANPVVDLYEKKISYPPKLISYPIARALFAFLGYLRNDD